MSGKFIVSMSLKKRSCRFSCREGLLKPPAASKRPVENSPNPRPGYSPQSPANYPLAKSKNSYESFVHIVRADQVRRPKPTLKKSSGKPDARLDELESMHAGANNGTLKLQKGGRLTLGDKSVRLAKKVKVVPDFSLDLVDLNDSMGGECALDDEGELPDASELLASSSRVDRTPCLTSETDYSNPEMTALIRDAPMEELVLISHERNMAKGDEETNISTKPNLKRRLVDLSTPSPSLQPNSPLKRVKRDEAQFDISSPSTLQKPRRRTSPWKLKNDSPLSAIDNQSYKQPLFLPNYPTDSHIIDYSITHLKVDDTTQGPDTGDGFTLDDDLFNALPSATLVSKANVSKFTPIKISQNVPSDSSFRTDPKDSCSTSQSPTINTLQDNDNDDLAELDAWLLSGAVEIGD